MKNDWMRASPFKKMKLYPK